MKKEKIIIGVMGFVVLIAVVLIVNQLDDNTDNLQEQMSLNVNVFETKSSQGKVTIDLKPKGIIDGNAVFDIVLNTHTVDLSQYNLEKITVLKVNGQEYNPIQAPILTGHHNTGEISFNIDQLSKPFMVIITGIPDVEMREFKW